MTNCHMTAVKLILKLITLQEKTKENKQISLCILYLDKTVKKTFGEDTVLEYGSL